MNMSSIFLILSFSIFIYDASAKQSGFASMANNSELEKEVGLDSKENKPVEEQVVVKSNQPYVSKYKNQPDPPSAGWTIMKDHPKVFCDEKKYSDKDIDKWAQEYLKDAVNGEPNATPQVVVTMGGSGSGKGILSKFLLHEHDHLVLHGLDEYLQFIPEWKIIEADKKTRYKSAADACMGTCIRTARRALELIISRKISLIYEETGKNMDRVLKRVVPQFKAAGYDIYLAFVDGVEEQAISRAWNRFLDTGRYASPEYIESTFVGGNLIENYHILRDNPIFEPVSIYCNNTKIDSIKCWENQRSKKEADNFLGQPCNFCEESEIEYLDPAKMMVFKLHTGGGGGEL